MLSSGDSLYVQDRLSKDKEILLKKLSTIFDPQTAIDFVSPKTHETRRHLTIEDLKNASLEQPEDHLQRLRSMDHYQTTTQSLSRVDLETSYQAFVRSECGQPQNSRGDLEQFVRNSSDIDAAQRYHDPAHDPLYNPLQSQLLFHSSKLNEQRANLLKSAGSSRSLKQINDHFSLQKYFPENLTSKTQSRSSPKEKKISDQKPKRPSPRSMHVEHGEKKYRIKFIKDSNTLPQEPLQRFTNNRKLGLVQGKNLESLFGTETSTTHGPSSSTYTSNIHRETFPPLSLSALKEYRPTLTPKSASTIHSQDQQQTHPRKVLTKTDFIWEHSIVSPLHEQ